VGWDGATFNVADPMIAEGKLPNLAKLMARGARCKLRSTVPPNSSIAWVSFATGKQAGKHGVYYFVERQPGSYERRLINATSIQTETLWSLLSRHEKKISVLNVPVTYPPRPVNGTLVAGMLSPSLESNFTWPPTLHTEIMANVGWLPLDHQEAGVAYSPDRLRLLDEIWRDQEQRCSVAKYLMDRDPWEFFMVVLTSSDRIGHVAFRFQDEGFRKESPELVDKFGTILQDTYAQLDRLTGELLAKVDDETTVILMSDHGMGPLRKRFRLAKWLIDEGYLVLKPNAEKLRRGWEIRPRRLTERLRLRAPGRYMRPPWELVDWSRTKAFVSWGGGEDVVLINMAGRDPEGIVQPGEEYERVCDEICRKLEAFEDPSTGRPVVTGAHKRADLWHGHAVELAPDIQFEVDDVAYHIDCGLFEKEVLHEPVDKVPGMHRMDGICIVAGPGIPAGVEVERNELIDLAPTVCHLLDVPVPEDMDGKVMENCFTQEFRQAHPVELGPPTLSADHGGKQDFDDTEADAVAETLRAMGYVS
jgi:predicted AlkP superfamily phosphohydrolase/phosphomutase